MKALTFALATLLALVSVVHGLPSFANLSDDERTAAVELMKRSAGKRQLQIPTVGRKKFPDDDHPFQAPSATAQRGPCPGLNVLANHGYINREGITNFDELLYAQQEVMGWAVDLATLLASISIAVDGNPLNGKVSIGGPDSRVGSLPLSGTIPGGILRHNAYEIDSSLTRNDKYFGDNKDLNGTLYQQIWEVADQMNNGQLNGDVMAQVRSNRYEASALDNPQFTFAPIGALFFGADQFLYNTQVSSDETGEPGPSNRDTLSEMYGAQRTGETTWQYVPERFPAEWYRRARPLTIAEGVANALPTVLLAAEKGHLPVGITAASLKSPEAFICALKSVTINQLPAAILGIDAVAAFLTTLGSLGSTC